MCKTCIYTFKSPSVISRCGLRLAFFELDLFSTTPVSHPCSQQTGFIVEVTRFEAIYKEKHYLLPRQARFVLHKNAILSCTKVMIETFQINELSTVLIREGACSLGKTIPAKERVMYLPALTRFRQNFEHFGCFYLNQITHNSFSDRFCLPFGFTKQYLFFPPTDGNNINLDATTPMM